VRENRRTIRKTRRRMQVVDLRFTLQSSLLKKRQLMEVFREKINHALAACMEGIGEDMTSESLAAGVRKAVAMLRSIPVESVPSELQEEFNLVVSSSLESADNIAEIASEIAWFHYTLEGGGDQNDGLVEYHQ
jgi:hypothetical protein